MKTLYILLLFFITNFISLSEVQAWSRNSPQHQRQQAMKQQQRSRAPITSSNTGNYRSNRSSKCSPSNPQACSPYISRSKDYDEYKPQQQRHIPSPPPQHFSPPGPESVTITTNENLPQRNTYPKEPHNSLVVESVPMVNPSSASQAQNSAPLPPAPSTENYEEPTEYSIAAPCAQDGGCAIAPPITDLLSRDASQITDRIINGPSTQIRDNQKGCGQTDSSPAVVDILSRVVLPTYVLSYDDSTGRGSASVNVANIDPAHIGAANLDSYFDAVFPPRKERLSVVKCQQNQAEFFLNNGFNIFVHNSKNPARPAVACYRGSYTFTACEQGLLPTYLSQGIVGGRNGSNSKNRQLLKLVRSTIAKIQRSHPACSPFNQVNIADIDALLNDHTNYPNDLPPHAINALNILPGIKFETNTSETLRNIVYSFRGLMMEIACS